MLSMYRKSLCERDARMLLSLAHTLLQRRSLLRWRSFAVAYPFQDFGNLDISRPVYSRPSSELSLSFVFTGQGAQWLGMGRELFVYDVFRQSIQDAISYLMGVGCFLHLAGKWCCDPAHLRAC